ncbi:PTS galactitol transporter subunit IIB [Shouchella clausii]|jgi:galactitol PTS system EIIB component|uniref:B component PTS system galactitol-specific enzyme II n=3 Tax=Shouchella TaxID=2893057 RepID=Q5WC06_SHOC1|nr:MULTISPECIES: PTS galactitol transporter subunit IIB [Shouchella]MCM3310911.1 PTS galactitol transporter subunit IIB [Psychrobacillus sp. MER TA 17]ALA53480.1 PTS system, galactitol-specific IIB component [Shouchella clausii]KKI86102.1 PTS galactitol transporter subunit IIB [Shouchella clausii]MBU3229928.1 PTS galactitol transporter subunit IIB [Shouchella clausii]MBU3263988.1 PTS galactitol transporter subunit IIB [Shouchella clausii]
MKKVLVACGGAVATSTVAANKVKAILKENNIQADVSQCRVSELGSKAQGADLIISTAKVDRDYGVPVIHGLPFISGVGLDKTKQEILDILK